MFRSAVKRNFPLILLVLVNLVCGLLVLKGFGESVDELSQNLYAERTIQAVQSFMSTGVMAGSFIEESAKQGSHGPAFIISVNLLRRLLLADGNKVEKLYFGHYLYFLVFLLGVVSIFFIARRWMSEFAALGTALLFNTQPILLGHAFMNPKDVVFMSLLTASVAVGFWMMDRPARPYKPTGNLLQDGFRSFLSEFLSADVWLAGVVLGFASAVRIAAPLTVLVIFAAILVARKWQTLPKFFAYSLIAFCFMVVFWPYLWPDPIGRLLGSVVNSAQYPESHVTLFKGTVFNAEDIPGSYLPVLLTAQLTETTLLLALVGLFPFLKKLRWDLAALVLIWFVLPTLAVILVGVNLYNNFRQVFFILPPIFLLAGLGLDWLSSLARRPAVRYLILCLMLLPGLAANIRLHPYQYVYYNQLVGGLNGAYRTYELDYWNLAYKEAQVYINKNAPLRANVYAYNSSYVARTFARRDLDFNRFGRRNLNSYDFIIVSTATNLDQKLASFPTVFVVEREGVPLAYVKKPKP